AVQFVSDVVTALTAAGPTTTSTSSTTTTTGGATTTTTGGGTTSTTGGATTTTTTPARTTTTLGSTLTCGPSGVVARLAGSLGPRPIAAAATRGPHPPRRALPRHGEHPRVPSRDRRLAVHDHHGHRRHDDLRRSGRRQQRRRRHTPDPLRSDWGPLLPARRHGRDPLRLHAVSADL